MHLWDWRTGHNFQRVHAAVQPGSLDSESGIFACAFDQSESRLLTAEADKTIKVYREDETATEETSSSQMETRDYQEEEILVGTVFMAVPLFLAWR
ncbi:Pleiotropic regulator 1 [Microtus ochrogaster]|uniref:Pleiotropic regulator 1 n=1 Tax=Microtus ochrogaster TaxID=79684 RepID=A0A8J6KLX5_MICOH|nr:Pleiotropic regulator 1 [Microtus ochrogaster]